MSFTATRWPYRRLPAAVALALALPACVVVPQTREVYDPECRMMKKEVRLESAVVGRFRACQGDACVAILVAAGAVTAATAVVSGSLALIGNVAYWFERQGQCSRAEPVPGAGGPATPAESAEAAWPATATG
jgi:hypothetical protein